jgi:anhydro-N-acetylmuramic acid kinase
LAELYIGLISGTSADGIDAALVDLGGTAPRLAAACTIPYPAPLRAELLGFMQGRYRGDPVDQLLALDRALGVCFADAAAAVMRAANVSAHQVRAIGSHGQTLRHRPPVSTLQAGDANEIAARTGITVVADFRRMDLAFGGEGAPLVPAFHAAAFAAPGESRAIVNLGGIANLTLLDAGGGVAGGDIGPANALLDAWCEAHTGEHYDRDGRWAASGTVDQALLAALRDEPYFARPMPKSTGRELFSLEWLAARLADQAPADVQATLVELTASTVADVLASAGATKAWLCGGGYRNQHLVARLRAIAGGVELAGTETIGIDPDFVEAAAFAWLAQRSLAGRSGNEPAATGASRRVVLGGRYGPP